MPIKGRSKCRFFKKDIVQFIREEKIGRGSYIKTKGIPNLTLHSFSTKQTASSVRCVSAKASCGWLRYPAKDTRGLKRFGQSFINSEFSR